MEYILGTTFRVEIDHKPLVSLSGYKHLDELSPRIQRMRMRLMRSSYTISHVPGKDSIIPDTLSRAPIYRKLSCEEQALADNVKVYVDFVLKNLSTAKSRLQEIREKLQHDEVCRHRSCHIVKMDGQKNSMLKEPPNRIISFLEGILNDIWTTQTKNFQKRFLNISNVVMFALI